MPSVRTTTIPANQVSMELVPGDVSSTMVAGAEGDAAAATGQIPGERDIHSSDMDEEEFLRGFRARRGMGTAQPTPAATISASINEDEFLKGFRQRRGIGTDAGAQVAETVPTGPSGQGQAPQQEQFPLGQGFSQLYGVAQQGLHMLPQGLQSLIRENPELAGAGAAVAIPLAMALAPEAGLAAGAGAVARFAWPFARAGIKGLFDVAKLGALGDIVTEGKLHEKAIRIMGYLSHLDQASAE